MTDPVVIIGAGPAGLSAAYTLARAKVPVIVLEQDPHYLGGLSRTVEYKGYRFDIGGHRFFSKSQQVMRFWHEILGDELLERQRLSRIFFRGMFFDYPLRPRDVFGKLGIGYAVKCATSFVKAQLIKPLKIETFEEWVIFNFGEELYRTFFKSYTEKVWGMPCSKISADWAAQRIRGLNLLSLARHTLFGERKQRVIKTLIDRFYYPRLGPGQMWHKLAERISELGGSIISAQRVNQITIEQTGATVSTQSADEQVHTYRAANIISTMPIRSLVRALRPAVSHALREAAEGLRYRDFLMVSLIIHKKEVFPDNWIYIHEPSVRVGRIQNFKNWSPDLVPDQAYTCLGMEYFCFENDDLWSLDDGQLQRLAVSELQALGLVDANDVKDCCIVRVPKAYPVYDKSYKGNLRLISDEIDQRYPIIQLVGRNGMHRYNNQDHAVMTGFLAAHNIIHGAKMFDLWRVNDEAHYLEQVNEGETLAEDRLVPIRIE